MGSQQDMPFDPRRPDLAVVLPLDLHSPRSARHCVGQVDHPSPDLRDAVMLLCSELVTEAVERSTGEMIELRVWMPEDVVRVEMLGAPHELSRASHKHSGYASLLLDQLADRWELEASEEGVRMWFEIDRRAVAVPAASVC
jgi:hypothetical protein